MSKNFFVKKIGLPRLLIIGCGNIGIRLLNLLHKRFRIFAVTKNLKIFFKLRSLGVIPILIDLGDYKSLKRLKKIANIIIFLAPPFSKDIYDKGSRNLFSVFNKNLILMYISTTGVYGNCNSDFIDETRLVNPCTERAKRRIDAEQIWKIWARFLKNKLIILRVPGIYSKSRLPLERLKNKIGALVESEDVFTNHIHANDLARLIIFAINRGLSLRVYNTVDDSNLKMADYFDKISNLFKLPKSPRFSYFELKNQKNVSSFLLSFMSESRRIHNKRIKKELKFIFNYSDINDFFIKNKSILKI
ncbi:SDR family NAD(P)-dependent oxidoreductase [Candidatus Profftella armatura]|uniref:SDR family NAD(P)-dependent oxidoreductase n=1 Tax=Candidatus Profftella armatura TaxID=669502 RepID=UPI003D9788E5